MRSRKPSSTTIAKKMIQRYGMQANAVAQEREILAGLVPDAEALSLWRSVQRAIAELRITSIHAAAAQAQPAFGGTI